MITGKNESKLFVKHVTCDYRCTLYGKKKQEKSYNGRCKCKKSSVCVYAGKIVCGISVYVLVTVIKSVRLKNT